MTPEAKSTFRLSRLRATLFFAGALFGAALIANQALVVAWPVAVEIYSRTQDAVADNLEPGSVQRIQPVYPAQLKINGIEGVVEATYTIDIDGSVTNVEVAGSPYSEFRDSVRDAVSQWRFDPPRMNGAGVRLTRSVHVRFERPDCNRSQIERAQSHQDGLGEPAT